MHFLGRIAGEIFPFCICCIRRCDELVAGRGRISKPFFRRSKRGRQKRRETHRKSRMNNMSYFHFNVFSPRLWEIYARGSIVLYEMAPAPTSNRGSELGCNFVALDLFDYRFGCRHKYVAVTFLVFHL